MDPKYIAQLLKEQPSEVISAFLHLEDPSYNAISVVRNLSPEQQEQLIDALPTLQQKAMLLQGTGNQELALKKIQQLEPAAAVDFLQYYEPKEAGNVLQKLDTNTATIILAKMPEKQSLAVMKQLDNDALTQILDSSVNHVDNDIKDRMRLLQLAGSLDTNDTKLK